MVKTPYRFLISHQTQTPPCCKKARFVLRWLQVWEKKILLLGRYSKPLLMWDTWSRCLWRYIGRNQMVAGARTLFCTEARSLLLINELYDTNWWNSGNFSGYDIFQSSYSLKQTGNDRVLSAELDVYTSAECCGSNVTIPMFRNHQIKHNIYVLRYR